MVRDEHLRLRMIRAWIRIHEKLEEWLLTVNNLPKNREAPLPDFSDCYSEL